MIELNEDQVSTLANIVSATASEAGMCYMDEESAQVFVDADLAECNINLTNPNSPMQFAVRATATGMAYDFTSLATEKGTNTVENPATQFAIEDDVKIPAIKRKGPANSVYPFDALEVGQSFFVPATEDMPNPGKSLASTVSSASKRYATENGTRIINRRNRETNEMHQVEVPAYEYERKFIVRTVEENGVKGARVWRIDIEFDDD